MGTDTLTDPAADHILDTRSGTTAAALNRRLDGRTGSAEPWRAVQAPDRTAGIGTALGRAGGKGLRSGKETEEQQRWTEEGGRSAEVKRSRRRGIQD